MIRSLDMYTIGIGPSSSHTIGPMRAAYKFVLQLQQQNILQHTDKLQVEFFGSLALTGIGHGTIIAALNGLCGEEPKTTNPDLFIQRADNIKNSSRLNLFATHEINFDYSQDIIIHKDKFLPQHSNAMRFSAYDAHHNILYTKDFFSIGGGFISDEIEINHPQTEATKLQIPYPYTTAAELEAHCKSNNLKVSEIALANELVDKSLEETNQIIDEIISVMHNSIVKGLSTSGILPGGLNVRRRAPNLFNKLNTPELASNQSMQKMMAMVYAMAVNEENAAFSKIVTAPTNGSAGTIPAVLEYFRKFVTNEPQLLRDFILTSGAIGVLYKLGASISAAEVGCQGEIGVACSMAAGALTEVLGGNIDAVNKAAEIAMEHSLGMTCDPIGGLVQIPCIERNGVAVTRAIDISHLALLEPSPGLISLDSVIKTMLETGRDMSLKYKETSLAGLAVNIPIC